MRVTSFAPQFLVADLDRSIAYYEKIGFRFDEPWDGFYATLGTTAWGTKDFYIEDPGGNVVSFGGSRRGRTDARLMANVSTVLCACVGGFLGYLGFVLLLDRGFYALVLPGGLLGLAAGIPRSRSLVVPALCGILGIVAGLLAEHRFAPFVADRSLRYFLLHAKDLQPMTMGLIGLGGVIGFWVPFRRRVRRETSRP